MGPERSKESKTRARAASVHLRTRSKHRLVELPQKRKKQASEFAGLLHTQQTVHIFKRVTQWLRTSAYDLPTCTKNRRASGRVCENSHYHDVLRETRSNQARKHLKNVLIAARWLGEQARMLVTSVAYFSQTPHLLTNSAPIEWRPKTPGCLR